MGKTTNILATALLCACASAAGAALPTTVSYQGYLTDDAGAAVDGNVVMTLALYAVEIGGAPLWIDAQVVAVSSGLFTVELGRVANPFPPGLFDTPLYLGVTVDPDNEMLPRRSLDSVGFAFKADDALTVQGLSASALDQSTHVADTDNPHGVTAAQAGAASSADIAGLQAQLDAATAAVAALQTDLAAANSAIAALLVSLGDETAARIAADDAEAATRAAADATHDADIAAIEANSVLTLDGRLSLSGSDTALFEGVNLQVVNGMGTTDTTNGVGNVIVGYDAITSFPLPVCSLGEFDDQVDCETNGGVWANSHKSGSHSLVVGDEHNYSRFGSILGGFGNHATGEWSSAIGGIENFATGFQVSIVGGRNNSASGNRASVLGGVFNRASGESSVAAGGSGNTASGTNASALGGISNEATGANASVSAGFGNVAAGDRSSIVGGQQNTASGFSATVGGGRFNEAGGDYSSVHGGGGDMSFQGNAAYAHYSAVLGGENNAAGDSASPAIGAASTVSGGFGNSTTASNASVSGGSGNVASGLFSAVTGGIGNEASGLYSAVSGGASNDAIGSSASVSGGFQNDAVSQESSVSGGVDNDATGGRWTSVSGGVNRSTVDIGDWAAGSLLEDQ